MTGKLIRGGAAVQKPKHSGVARQLLSLSDEEKYDLIEGLLDELGASNITLNGDEMIMSCLVPDLHANGDQHPSASLNWRKMVYHCHACGSGGGIAWLIATCHGDVDRWFKDRELEEDDGTMSRSRRELDRKPRSIIVRPPIPELDETVLDRFDGIPDYMLNDRHIPLTTLIAMRVRYDSNEHRVIIPHFWNGRLVGWQSRRIEDDGSPKYRNTPEFPKRETLYNLPANRDAVLVVESPMSVLSKMHVFPNMVATFGASVTKTQIELLGTFPSVVLWFDNDNAGWEATRNVGNALSAYSDVSVVASELDADPADLSDEDFAGLSHIRMPYTIWRPPTELVDYMSLRKFGSGDGEVIDDDQKPVTKTAATDPWTDDDDKELATELAN